MAIHKFMSASGFDNESQFYSKYKTADQFFRDYPDMEPKKMKRGGKGSTWDADHSSFFKAGGNYNPIKVVADYKPPIDHSVENSFRNTQETRGTTDFKPYDNSNAICYECGGMTKPYMTGGRYLPDFDTYQMGGMPIVQTGFFPQQTPDIPFDRRADDSTYYDQLLRTDPNKARYLFDQYQKVPEALGKPTLDAYNAAWKTYDKQTNTTGQRGRYPMHMEMQNKQMGGGVKMRDLDVNLGNYANGGKVDMPDLEVDLGNYKKGGKWIQGAIKHPGRCTPGSSNYDCPKGSPQWNLAQRFKHGDLHKKQEGGVTNTWEVQKSPYTYKDSDAQFSQDPVAQQQMIGKQSSNQPNVSPTYASNQPMMENVPSQSMPGSHQPQQQSNMSAQPNNMQRPNWGAMAPNLIGAGILAGNAYNAQRQQEYNRQNARTHGMTSSLYPNPINPQGTKGDYTQQGNFRPQQQVVSAPGGYAYGGQYKDGGVYDISEQEISRLKNSGFKVEYI